VTLPDRAPIARRWVIKLGTGILTDARGHVDVAQIRQLAAQVIELRRRGHQVLVVSSGAVGCGMSLLGLTRRPTLMAELQACAALGQPRLLSLWDAAFGKFDVRVAQVLLTYPDLDSRSLYGNIQRSVEHLLAHETIVPIFNENDVVSYDELIGPRFGDNDQLSAHVAVLARAGRLIILSNVRGLATNSDGTGKLIPEVRKIDARIEKLAGGTRSQTSVGGMISKLKAARVANQAGIPMQIAHGRQKGVLVSICQGKPVGTIFHP
jgi:glutamate 5-kinase